MKSFALVLTCLLAVGAWAAPKTSSKNVITLKELSIKAPKAKYASRGLRVALIKPAWEFQVSSRIGSDESSLDGGYGLSVGIAKLPVGRFGYVASGSLIDASARLARINFNETYQILRLDGNLAYTFNNRMHAKGGLNITRLMRGREADKFSAGIGWQAGIGGQFTPNVGVDFTLVRMRQSGVVNSIGIDFEQVGSELAINGTF